jgi:CheY-like chemotaxis protein
VESYLLSKKNKYYKDEAADGNSSDYNNIEYNRNNPFNNPNPPMKKLAEDGIGSSSIINRLHSTKENSKPLDKLLLVDDDSDIVQVLNLGLTQNGFLVGAFTNPEEALQSFKSDAESYFLVLSDVRMPKLSGIQVARKVKAINPNVKVMLMTAFEIRDNEFSTVFPSTQVDGFVQKPIGIKDLTSKILSLIDGGRERSNGER